MTLSSVEKMERCCEVLLSKEKFNKERLVGIRDYYKRNKRLTDGQKKAINNIYTGFKVGEHYDPESSSDSSDEESEQEPDPADKVRMAMGFLMQAVNELMQRSR